MPGVYQWDGTRLAGRTNATGTSLGDYQHAYGWAISSREGGIRNTLHTDVHGTPQLITDSTGAIAGWTRTDVWGVEKAQNGAQSRLGHTGYLKDPLLGDELYAQARQYRAGTGRFTSRDEWSGDNLNPITLNKYLYANGNPGSYIDPSGNCAEPVTFTLCVAGLSSVIGWASSVIHDEVTTGASFAEAATNPRNLRNGVAVGGAVLSGGTLGIPVTAGLVTLGAGTDVAMQMNLEGKAYDQVDYERAVANGGITAGGGAVLGAGLGSANVYISSGSKVVATGLVGMGAVESGHLIGEGLASGNPGQIALGTGFAGFSLAGGLAMPRMLSPQLNSAELDASLNSMQPKAGSAVVVEGGDGALGLSMETGPYRVMSNRTDIPGQAHHLNQDAMFGEIIPRGRAVSVKLKGDAFQEPGTPHYQVHQAQETYLNQFRRGGERFGEKPTNLEMSRATVDALQSGGYTRDQAMALARVAMRDRVKYGLLGGEEVPRIPRRINQKKQDEP